MPLRIDWHPEAVRDLSRLATADQRRIKRTLDEIQKLDDARLRLAPYFGSLKGFWKLRVGDHRLVCRIETRDGASILVIYVAHRSVAYGAQGVRELKSRD